MRSKLLLFLVFYSIPFLQAQTTISVTEGVGTSVRLQQDQSCLGVANSYQYNYLASLIEFKLRSEPVFIGSNVIVQGRVQKQQGAFLQNNICNVRTMICGKSNLNPSSYSIKAGDQYLDFSLSIPISKFTNNQIELYSMTESATSNDHGACGPITIVLSNNNTGGSSNSGGASSGSDPEQCSGNCISSYPDFCQNAPARVYISCEEDASYQIELVAVDAEGNEYSLGRNLARTYNNVYLSNVKKSGTYQLRYHAISTTDPAITGLYPFDIEGGSVEIHMPATFATTEDAKTYCMKDLTPFELTAENMKTLAVYTLTGDAVEPDVANIQLGDGTANVSIFKTGSYYAQSISDKGCVSYKSPVFKATVFSSPVANFTLSKDHVKPDEEIEITDASEDASSLKLTVSDADGNIVFTSDQLSSKLSLKKGGEYTVKLTAIANEKEGCTDNKEASIFVCDIPEEREIEVVDATSFDGIDCYSNKSRLTLSVEPQEGETFRWSANGKEIPGATAPSYQPDDYTGKDVQYSVAISNDCGVIKTEEKIVRGYFQPTLDFDISGNCASDKINFENKTVGLLDGVGNLYYLIDDEKVPTPAEKYEASERDHTIVMVYEIGPFKDQLDKTFTIKPVPTISIQVLDHQGESQVRSCSDAKVEATATEGSVTHWYMSGIESSEFTSASFTTTQSIPALTATADLDGCISEKSNELSIEVIKKPIANLSVSKENLKPNELVSVESKSANASSYRFEVKNETDELVQSSESMPYEFSLVDAGTYKLSLFALSDLDECKDQAEKSITVCSYPATRDVSVTGQTEFGNISCYSNISPLTFSVEKKDGETYQWKGSSIIKGATSNTFQPDDYSGANKQYLLAISNTCGEIEINAGEVRGYHQANIDFTVNSACADDDVSLTDRTTGIVKGVGNVSFIIDDEKVDNVPNSFDSGDHTISMIYQAGPFIDKVDKTFTVREVPVINIAALGQPAATQLTACDKLTVEAKTSEDATVQWFIDDALSKTFTTKSINLNQTASKLVAVANLGGCLSQPSNALSIQINKSIPSVFTLPQTSICQDTTGLSFSPNNKVTSSKASFLWSLASLDEPDSPIFTSIKKTPTIFLEEAGDFVLTLKTTNPSGCTSELSIPYHVDGLPTGEVNTANAEICYLSGSPLPITVSNISENTDVEVSKAGVIYPFTVSKGFSPKNSGLYLFRFSNQCGIKETTVNATVFSESKITPSVTVDSSCVGTQLHLSVSSTLPYQFSWSVSGEQFVGKRVDIPLTETESLDGQLKIQASKECFKVIEFKTPEISEPSSFNVIFPEIVCPNSNTNISLKTTEENIAFSSWSNGLLVGSSSEFILPVKEQNIPLRFVAKNLTSGCYSVIDTIVRLSTPPDANLSYEQGCGNNILLSYKKSLNDSPIDHLVATLKDGRVFQITVNEPVSVPFDTSSVKQATITYQAIGACQSKAKTLDVKIEPQFKGQISAPEYATTDDLVQIGYTSSISRTIASFSYSISDGASLDGKNIEHQFAYSGDYTIELTLVDVQGCTYQIDKAIKVIDPNIAIFSINDNFDTFTYSICDPSSENIFKLKDLTQETEFVSNWKWTSSPELNFGGSEPVLEHVFNPTLHIPAGIAPGLYWATLSVYNGMLWTTAQDTVWIQIAATLNRDIVISDQTNTSMNSAYFVVTTTGDYAPSESILFRDQEYFPDETDGTTSTYYIDAERLDGAEEKVDLVYSDDCNQYSNTATITIDPKLFVTTPKDSTSNAKDSIPSISNIDPSNLTDTQVEVIQMIKGADGKLTTWKDTTFTSLEEAQKYPISTPEYKIIVNGKELASGQDFSQEVSKSTDNNPKLWEMPNTVNTNDMSVINQRLFPVAEYSLIAYIHLVVLNKGIKVEEINVDQEQLKSENYNKESIFQKYGLAHDLPTNRYTYILEITFIDYNLSKVNSTGVFTVR